jgi:serine/threonine-protein kinase
VAGGAGIQILASGDESAPGDGVAEATPPAPGPRDRGHLRVVARPWAEVYLDGERIDVTPIGRPIPVVTGKHFVTFRHPYAADEQRTIKIAAGQTVFLDVTMRVERGDAGAPRPDAGPDPAASP